jgi:hypothetical protein
MKLKPLQLLLIALVLLVLLAAGDAAAGTASADDTSTEDEATDGTDFDVTSTSIDNGPLVGPATSVGDDGLVADDPAELAAAAGLDLETYALARCLVSEHGQQPNAYLVAVGWAVTNYAGEKGESIFELLTNGHNGGGSGYFGEQKAAAGTKYAATEQDPHQRHVDAANAVRSGSVPDPTGGCTHFFSPRAQDALAAKAAAGDARYAKYLGKDAAFIMSSWAAPGGLYAQGAVAVVPPGIDGRTLTLWRAA